MTGPEAAGKTRRESAAILLLPIMAGLMAGCAARTVNVPPWAAAGLEASLRPAGEAIAATARFEVTSHGKRYVREAALLMKGPSSLRLEFIPPLGPPDLFLSLTADELRVFAAAKGEFYAGRAGPANIGRFLFMEINPQEIVALLMGRVPVPAWPLTNAMQEGSLFRLDLEGPEGLSRSLWLDQSRRIVRTVLYRQDGSLIYTAEFADHTPVGGMDFPRRLKIESADLAVVVLYGYVSVIDAPAGAFILDAPSGVTMRPLD